ncbi:MAG: TRAP transporter substrate-binding protein [Clostridiales bacterium]|nr:TRAP transporter substrate-binding protein [Clostridiales bacterium]
MKRKSILFLVVLLIAALTVGMGGCGGNGDSATSGDADKVYTLRIGTGSGGRDHQNVFMERIKEELEARSEGQLVVELYPAGQIGNMAQLVQGVQDGSVDSVCIPTTYFATVIPEMTILDMPYLWKDAARGTRILMENSTSLDKIIEDAGLVQAGYIRNAERLLISNRDLTKVKTLEDLKAMRLKTFCHPSEVIQAEVEALGGIYSNIDVGELTPSLQNKTLDAAMISATLYYPFGVHEVAPYMLMAPRDAMISVYMINRNYFEGLPEDLQQLVLDTAREVNDEVFEYAGEYEELCISSMLEEGLTIVEPSPELAQEIRDACLSVADQFLAKYPEMKDLYEEFKALSAKYE